jgi:hypothetical protein
MRYLQDVVVMAVVFSLGAGIGALVMYHNDPLRKRLRAYKESL